MCNYKLLIFGDLLLCILIYIGLKVFRQEIQIFSVAATELTHVHVCSTHVVEIYLL
jgi:hypothetical protein